MTAFKPRQIVKILGKHGLLKGIIKESGSTEKEFLKLK
jgi:hypothetical protein